MILMVFIKQRIVVNCGYEICGVFLDIYLRLLIKYDIEVCYWNWNKMVSTELYQKLKIGGQHFTWSDVLARVHQSSIIGPLAFLVDIKSLPDGPHSNLFLPFISLFLLKFTVLTKQGINDVIRINNWA